MTMTTKTLAVLVAASCCVGAALAQNAATLTGQPSPAGPISTTLGAAAGGWDPASAQYSAPAATGAAPANFQWGGAWEFPLTSTLREASRVLSAFGPGLRALQPGDPNLQQTRAAFDIKSNVTYPILLTAGHLKNGSRAGLIQIGVKDLAAKLQALPKSQANTLLFSGAVPFPMGATPDQVLGAPLAALPESVAFQLVCHEDPAQMWLNHIVDAQAGRCENRAVELRPQLLPEFVFLVRMICGEMKGGAVKGDAQSPAQAWAEQCEEWHGAPLVTGRNCMWQPPKNITFGDPEANLARIVEDKLEVSMLLNPTAVSAAATDVNALKTSTPIMMQARQEMVEEFLHTVGAPAAVAGGLPAPLAVPMFPGAPWNNPEATQERLNSVAAGGPAPAGRKLLQVAGMPMVGQTQPGAISVSAEPLPRPALTATDAGLLNEALAGVAAPPAADFSDKIGVVLERMLETGLIPHAPRQLTRAQGMELISTCQ